MVIQRANFCLEIDPCTCYCSRCCSNIQVSAMQNLGLFCCYCSGKDDDFGEKCRDVRLYVCIPVYKRL